MAMIKSMTVEIAGHTVEIRSHDGEWFTAYLDGECEIAAGEMLTDLIEDIEFQLSK